MFNELLRPELANVGCLEGLAAPGLGFKLYPDGRHEEVFNGPGRLSFERYASRKGIGVQLPSFPIAELRKLSAKVQASERIPRRVL